MKAFSTNSAIMSIVRKDGFYMSLTTARTVVKKLTPVFGFSEHQAKLAISFLRGCGTDESVYAFFSGGESQALISLRGWYSMDSGFKAQKAFVTVDLNSGRALVIASKRDENEGTVTQRHYE